LQGSGRGHGWHAAAEELREKLGRFSGRPRFNDEFEEAFEFYFGESVENLQDSLDEADFDRFMEWFVFDFRLSNGHRLIEIFDLEHGADLSRSARRLLRAWENAHLSVLEYVGREGEVDTYVDLLTGKRYDVMPRPNEEQLTRWSIVIARPLKVGNRWEFSPSVTELPPVCKDLLVQLVRGEFRRHVHATNELGVERFLREQGYLFNDLLVELDSSAAAYLLEGNEAHRVVYSKAVFRVRDPVRVSQRLLAYADVRATRRERLVMFESEESSRVLAELHVGPSRLVVHCWSRERLEVAKRRLVERLKGLVLHLVDAFEELHARSSGRGVGLGTLNLDEVAAVTDGCRGESSDGVDGTCGLAMTTGVWAKAAYDDYVNSWLSQPLAYLHGHPPKALLGLPLGRIRLVELLKKLEHLQQSRLRKGRGLATTDELRRQLDLPVDSGLLFPLGVRPDTWNSEEEREAIECVEAILRAEGYSEEHIDSAVWIWWDFCYRAFPRVRKPEAWAAAVHYCVAFVENRAMTQAEAASRYGVSVGSVSTNSRRIIELLELDPFDDRYCVTHPVDGLLDRFGRGRDFADETPDPVAAKLALASRVRESVHQFAARHDGLQERAQDYFSSHVERSGIDGAWRECFLDWFHFDWRIPVMGGRTLAEEAYDSGELDDEIRDVLGEWVRCHPSFYVVEGMVEGGTIDLDRQNPKLTLRELVSGELTVVDWMRLGGPVRPKDLVFARIVPVDDKVFSLGYVLPYAAPHKEFLQKTIEEDRALVNRWNERYLSWEEFRARYAERLYSIAFALGHPEMEGDD